MTHNRSHGICYFIILFAIFICVCGDAQDYFKLQHSRKHRPVLDFDRNDYEHQEIEETQQVDNESPWDRQTLRQQDSPQKPSNISYKLDPNIKWDENWTTATTWGQLSAVSLDPTGNVGIFCRRERVWGQSTFSFDNKFDPRKGPILDNVIILLDKQGKILLEWGRNTFYMPHGLTIDADGNYWTTDVAMHMVMKFERKEIERNFEALRKEEASEPHEVDLDNLFKKSIVKPSLALGVPFEPGNDNQRFCKPTAVAVMKNGDFFVSDGYCNSRVIKFNARGERIMQFGRHFYPGFQQQPSPYVFYVPHALALADNLGFLYVADRENGRILCFHANNGTFHREYRHPAVGSRIYSIAYAQERLYTVNGADIYRGFHVRGFSLDIHSGDVVSQFGPKGDMKGPHDIAVSEDGSEIYAVELDAHVVYRFLQAGQTKPKTTSTPKPTEKNPVFGLSPLTSQSTGAEMKKVSPITIALSIIISATVIIGLAIAVAALIARCQKRGCLLPRKSYWENDTKNNFKLSRVLDGRAGKKGFRFFDKRPNTKDFSKLNTEETSEDEGAAEGLII